MSSITLASIETTIGDLFKTAVHRAQDFLHSVAGVADTIAKDATAAAPFAESVLAVVAPQDAGALAAVVGIINAVDSGLQSVDASAANGVTVTLPQELIATYKKAKSDILAYENSL